MDPEASEDDYLLSFQTIPLHACSNSALRLGIGDEILREADENFSGLPRSNFYRNRTKLFISMTLHNIVKCSLEIILFLALSDVVADVFGDNHISLWTALASATLSPLLTSTSGPILLVSVDLLLPSSLFPFWSPQIETRPCLCLAPTTHLQLFWCQLAAVSFSISTYSSFS